MDRLRICSGSRCSLWWGADASGRFRGLDYFNALKDPEKAKFDVLFELMAREGRIRSPEHFRKESGDIFCFKRSQHRLACFRDGSDWVILDGFRKKSDKDKRLKRHIETADRIRTEHMDRAQGDN